MRNELPRQEGRDHDTSRGGGAAVAAALLAAALSAVLPAHDTAAQGAVPCTAIDDDEERLACYDRALRGSPPAPPARVAPPAAVTPPPAAAPPGAARAPVQDDERPRERRVRESAAPAAPAAPPARAVAAAGDDEQIVPLVIVGVRTLPGRETTFTAEDGTSWVQTDSQRIFGLPDPPFDAELKRGAMGSHFLVPAERARAIRVRQVSR
jgi:hypothetical protein